jgi:hypothetical protein
MSFSEIDFLKKYDKKLVSDIVALTDKLARGRITDFAEYKGVVGRIQGLNDARGVLADMLKSDEDEDETGDLSK